jgi:hypothetical protein
MPPLGRTVATLLETRRVTGWEDPSQASAPLTYPLRRTILPQKRASQRPPDIDASLCQGGVLELFGRGGLARAGWPDWA